jgi:hypothetical protein
MAAILGRVRFLPFINHPWVVAIGSGLFFAAATKAVDDVVAVLEAVVQIIALILPFVANTSLVIFPLIALGIVRNWLLVPVADEPPVLRIAPLLRGLNTLKRRRFDLPTLEGIAARFYQLTGERYYALRGARPDGTVEYSATLQPVVVLKLPARPHLSLPDFQDLRLCREVIRAGGHVIVLVMDIDRSGAASPLIIEQAMMTSRMVRRLLGTAATVRCLSETLARNGSSSWRFILDGLLPFVAREFEKLGAFRTDSSSGSPDSPTFRTISFLNVALVLKAIDCILKRRRALVIIQWERRLAKWETAAAIVRAHTPQLEISGYLAAKDFLDPNGDKVSTSSSVLPDVFTFTEARGSVARKLLAKQPAIKAWVLSDDYLRHLSHVLFGVPGTRPESRHVSIWERRGLRRFLAKADPSVIPLQDAQGEDPLNGSLVLRFEFYKRFCAVQKALLR